MASLKKAEVKITGPLGSLLDGYNRSQPPSDQPTSSSQHSSDFQVFVDAMKVREEVFVHEQKVPLENEYDDDDPQCIHFVLYDGSDGTPAGTIRIVPFTSLGHPHMDKHRAIDGSPYAGEIKSSMHDGAAPFIKLGRLAVVKSQRGSGYAAALVDAAVQYAAKHPEMMSASGGVSWDGLILIHAQQQVQNFWARHGFALDEAMGIWDEEGIDHVAMWRKVECHPRHR